MVRLSSPGDCGRPEAGARGSSRPAADAIRLSNRDDATRCDRACRSPHCGAGSAPAQSFVCSPISAGETGPAVARRLTGDPENLYQPWFRFADPATGQFVPQSQHTNLRTDWRVCLARDAPALARRAPPASDRDGRTYDIGFAVRIGLAVFLVMLSWSLLEEYLRQTRPVPAPLRHHAQQFVDAFARPLLRQASTGPPIRSRLRYLPAREEVEILIAPSAGRRYPNLSDHKINVEYTYGGCYVCSRIVWW